MLSIHNLVRTFDGIPALNGVNLRVQEGEILCLLGPSGCGKTTLLRVIAGLEAADKGDVLLHGQSILDIPVHQRDFGLMFQDFALFPHMNVAQNILFGLRMHGVPAKEQQRLKEVLELVGLDGFERRDVAQLSGGERQRVALARSLAPKPRLLMLDEPLGSLDAVLRERLVVDLRNIMKQVGLTALYVTHDQKEAFAIADRIALMNAGRIEQADAPQTIYYRPKTVFAARFLGLNNIVPVLSQKENCTHTALGDFIVEGTPDFLLLHPDNLLMVLEDTEDAIIGRVLEVTFLGDSYRLDIVHESGVRLNLKISAQAAHIPGVGDTVAVQFDPERLVPLEEKS